MSTSSLIFFLFRAFPVAAWGAVVIQLVLLPLSLIIQGGGTRSGFTSMLSDPLSLMCVIILGFAVFTETINGRNVKFVGMPLNEFILTQPVSQRRVYYAIVGAYFVFVLAIPLVCLLCGFAKPDLQFSLFDDGVSKTDAAKYLASYQAAFPGSAIVESSGSRYPILLLPNALIKVLYWNFCVIAGVATAFQMAGAFRLPFKGVAPFFVLLGFLFVVKPELQQKAFLAFASHSGFGFGASLLLFAVVQLLIWKRTERMGLE